MSDAADDGQQDHGIFERFEAVGCVECVDYCNQMAGGNIPGVVSGGQANAALEDVDGGFTGVGVLVQAGTGRERD